MTIGEIGLYPSGGVSVRVYVPAPSPENVSIPESSTVAETFTLDVFVCDVGVDSTFLYF